MIPRGDGSAIDSVCWDSRLLLVPFGAEEAGEKAGLVTGDVGTNEGWSRSEADLEDVEVFEGSGLSC